MSSRPPLRIVYVLHAYPPYHNAGAETMAHAINRWLVGRGHRVTVLARNPGPTYTWDGLDVVSRGPARWVGRSLTGAIVLTHLDETPIAETAARAVGAPLVHVLHNDRQLTFHQVQYAALIVANTRWIQERIPAKLGHVPTVIVHPPTLGVAELPAAGRWRDAVTLVNPLEAKGAPLFYDLARRHPDRRFLVVGGAYGPQLPPPRLPNLAVRPNRPDMRPVWDQTRVLLAPSSYESFGKAAVEALAHGIPVVAHPTPGLIESLGPAGIFADRDDPESWDQVLAELDKATAYRKAAAAARARAIELEALTLAQLEDFEAALYRMNPT